MRRWVWRLAVAVVLVAAALVLRQTVFAPEPLAVRTVRVSRGRVEATITNSKAGTVKARRRAGLSTGTAGIVLSLDVERGDQVAQGQVLLRLDDAKQRSELQHTGRGLQVAEAVHSRACLGAARANRELRRNEELAASAIVSADRLDSLHTAAEMADADCQVRLAEVELAAAAVEVARAELDKTVLRAPFDAIVADVSVELGEWVTPSVPLMAAPDLIDALDPSSLYVSAPMDEVDANALHLGQQARVLIDSHRGQAFPGKVVRRAPYVLDIEHQNRTIEIEVELEDAKFSATLLPGTSADVEIILEVRDTVLRVPTYALLEDQRVLVVADSVLVERAVTTGLRNWDWTEITGGLQAGEQVVTSLDRPDVKAGTEVVVEAIDEES